MSLVFEPHSSWVLTNIYGKLNFKFKGNFEMRKLFSAVIATAILGIATVANAWEPKGPVTIVVASPAGSLHDRAIKSILPELEKQTGLEFIMDYKPGAASVKGIKSFLAMPANGQNLTLTASLSLVLSDITSPGVADWNWEKEFVQVGGVAQSTTSVVSTKMKTMSDLVTTIKSGQKVIVGTTYPNSEALVALLTKKVGGDMANIKFARYKDPAQALTDVVGGNIDIFVSGIAPSVPLYKAGKVNYLAVSSVKRLDFLPDVPTVAEVVPGLVMNVDLGMSIRSGSPNGAAEYWEKQITQATRTASAKAARTASFMSLDDEFISSKGQTGYYKMNRSTWEETYLQMFSKK
jgi:tripartite-type tricarboxylate transporter receptor subunit TctC